MVQSFFKRKFFKRILGVVALLLVALGSLVGIQHAIAKPNIRGYDPKEMGRLESAMWRSYYDRHWLKLGSLLLEGACGQFGFSWWDASRISLHAARAGLFFRDNTDDPRCLPELEQFFTIIREASRADLDVQALAALELEWWKARRQQVLPRDYALILAQQASLLIGVPVETLLPDCRIRTEAMAYLESRPGGIMTEADWQEIARQLERAYTGLMEATPLRR